MKKKSFFQHRCAEMTLACSGDAVIISDSAHRVTRLNAPAELLTGWSEAEARGHALNEILGETACVTRCPLPLVHTKTRLAPTPRYYGGVTESSCM